MGDTTAELEKAWKKRLPDFDETDAVRVFHGPGEGSEATRGWAIDRFGDHYWVTEWEGSNEPTHPVLDDIARFLRSKGALSAVALLRPERGVPTPPRVLLGSPPLGRFSVREGPARYLVQLTDVRHPGLFLDHAPLRTWLHAEARGLTVLNTFAYTGSLSIAAALGAAAHVTTLDLSRATIEWAEANARENALADDTLRFLSGDVFEWLPRLGREGKTYDCVILDPPSFSRGRKGTFSTAKDLPRLHALALDRVADGGLLVTSINSANVTARKFRSDVELAARERGVRLDVVYEVGLPPSFPARSPTERYLKGWAFRVSAKPRLAPMPTLKRS